MTQKKHIILNTLFQFGGRIGGGLMSIIIVKLISSYLGVAGYGEYASTYEFLSFFAIFADLGIFTIAVREMTKVENDKEKMEKIFGNVLAIRLVLTLTMMVVATTALYFIPQYNVTRIPNAAILASIATILTMMTGSLSSILQVFLKMGKATTAFMIGKLLSLIYISFVVLKLFESNSEIGFYHLYIAGVIGGIATTAITAYYAKQLASIKLHFDYEYCKKIIIEATPYGLAIIFNQIYFRVDSILLMLLKGPEEVGIYAVPMRILEVLMVVSFYFMNSTLPSLTRAFKQGAEELKKIIQFSFDFLVMLGAPIIVGTFILAYPIIFVISSPEFLSRVDEGFYGSDIAFKILTLALVGGYMSSLFTYVLVAIEKQKTVLWINAFGAVFNIVANLLIIPSYGARGAAWTSVMSEIIVVIMAYFICRSYVRIKLDLLTLTKILSSAAVMGVVIFYLRDPMYSFLSLQNKSIIILIPIGCLVYSVMLLMLGVVNKETLKNLRPDAKS